MSRKPPPSMLRFEYVNHRGERSTRTVLPNDWRYRALMPWYPTPSWLMQGYDQEKKELRTFQVAKMENIREIPA